MPITIGAKLPADFSAPVELLSDCHRRIETFLAVLARIAAQANGGQMTIEQGREWERALDYFRNAAPRHTADEEESLFPRLRRIDRGDVRSALSKMDELEGDHQRATEWHAFVERTGRRWLAERELSVADTELLRETLRSLQRLYEHHIAVEEEQIFPLAAAVLSGAEKADIGKEMRERRSR